LPEVKIIEPHTIGTLKNPIVSRRLNPLLKLTTSEETNNTI